MWFLVRTELPLCCMYGYKYPSRDAVAALLPQQAIKNIFNLAARIVRPAMESELISYDKRCSS